MIDTFSIFFSTGLCLVVIFRAIRLDRSRPWFPRLAAERAVPPQTGGSRGHRLAPPPA